MKRVFVFILTAGMLLALTGCAGATDPYGVTLAAADYEPEETMQEDDLEITFKRLTVCEGEYDIVIRSINPDAAEGYILRLDISNNAQTVQTTKTVYAYKTDSDGDKEIVGEEEVTVTTDRKYRFAVESAVINGKEVAVSYSTELSADDRTFDQIILDRAALEGLGVITEIRLPILVYAVGTEKSPEKVTALIYPYGSPDI